MYGRYRKDDYAWIAGLQVGEQVYVENCKVDETVLYIGTVDRILMRSIVVAFSSAFRPDDTIKARFRQTDGTRVGPRSARDYWRLLPKATKQKRKSRLS